jgi:hypothetical protein
MKKTINILKLTAILLILAGSFSCGEKEKEPNNTCCEKEEEIVKVLKDEPAYVKYNQLVESFTFELAAQYNEESFSSSGRFFLPCGNSIPEEYQIDELPVSISGDVIWCSEWSDPTVKLMPLYKFKLLNIQSRKKSTL